MKNEELLLYDVIWCVKYKNTCELKTYRKTFFTEAEAFLYQDYLWHHIKPEYSIIKTYFK